MRRRQALKDLMAGGAASSAFGAFGPAARDLEA
jgi:hypothetical protein